MDIIFIATKNVTLEQIKESAKRENFVKTKGYINLEYTKLVDNTHDSNKRMIAADDGEDIYDRIYGVKLKNATTTDREQFLKMQKKSDLYEAIDYNHQYKLISPSDLGIKTHQVVAENNPFDFMSFPDYGTRPFELRDKVAIFDTGISRYYKSINNQITGPLDQNGYNVYLHVRQECENVVPKDADYEGIPLYRKCKITHTGDSHATGVAALLCGLAKNEADSYTGILKKTELVNLNLVGEAYNGCGIENSSDELVCDSRKMLLAFKLATAAGAKIINASIASKKTKFDSCVHKVIEDFNSKGGISIWGAGNDGADELPFPQNQPNVISVGGLSYQNKPFACGDLESNISEDITIYALGTSVPIWTKLGGLKHPCGTSYSTVYVTGAIALLRSNARGKNLSFNQIKNKLIMSGGKLEFNNTAVKLDVKNFLN